MRKFIILGLILALAASGMQAQKRRRTAKRAKTALTPKEIMLQEKITAMTAATQKIVFIDSIVTDKSEFLKAINLPEEAGGIGKYNDFFNTDNQGNSYVYINEMRNKCYFSLEDKDGGMALYTSDLFDKEWSNPSKLSGLGDTGTDDLPNYPFMMADGTTLYFAAKGSESIGGYDIFVTRFNSETGKYFKAENIGMPFNSTANDYMYAIDEYDNLGWFVSDRNQPEGKVCVYIFIPSETREVYDPGAYSEEQIKRFAAIHKISDTWGNGKEKSQALERLTAMVKRQQQKEQKKKNEMAFVINDNTTYTELANFHSKENINKYLKLVRHIQNKKNLDAKLEMARNYYASVSDDEKSEISSEIINSERQSEELEILISKLTKELRNSENRFLNK